jgi:FKBP12-rapamycin complex-associated protein
MSKMPERSGKELAGAGPRVASSDTLSRHLDDMCRVGALERRKDGERYLLEYVEAEARDLSSEAFARFMNEIYFRIGMMVNKT